MKRKIIFAVGLSLLLAFCLWGCLPEGEGAADTTAAETTAQSTESTDAPDTTAEPAEVYWKTEQTAEGWDYFLYNKDGSVAEEIYSSPSKPTIELTDASLIRVTIEDETYYYDMEECIFSDTFTHVFDQYGTLFAYSDGERVTVRDIFNEEGYLVSFEDYEGKLCSSVEMPFLEARFVEGGAAVMVRYLAGDAGEEFCECFNVSGGSRFVLMEEWKNKKELITSKEKEETEKFLYSYCGRVEPNTGFEYSYNVTGTVMINGVRYYYCKCDLLIVGEDGGVTSTPVAEFVISESKDRRYDCRERGSDLIVYTEKNMI